MARFTELTGKKAPEPDTDLFGRNSSWDSVKRHDVYKDEEMNFGKYSGELIADIDDMEYLHWSLQSEIGVHSDRGQVIIKKLLSNGYKKSPYAEKINDHYDIVSSEKYDYLLNRKKEEDFLNSLNKGFHFEDKKRLDFNLKVLSKGSFEGTYGTCYIYTFCDSDKNFLKYMGSKCFDFDKGDTIKVKATVKHNEWCNNGGEVIKETKLLRIKELS
jgi:hypothetical protein